MWIVNKIWNSTKRNIVISLLQQYNQDYVEREVDLKKYWCRVLKEGSSIKASWVSKRTQLNYITDQNSARNLAVSLALDGRDGKGTNYEWFLPFDGNSFLTPAAWELIEQGLRDTEILNENVPHGSQCLAKMVPMLKVEREYLPNEKLLTLDISPEEAVNEPQIIFHRNIPREDAYFDPKWSYGNNNKQSVITRMTKKYDKPEFMEQCQSKIGFVCRLDRGITHPPSGWGRAYRKSIEYLYADVLQLIYLLKPSWPSDVCSTM
eukprot:CAMPEP_0174267574 /NCGR_PEP_ID=MMETSP0439-20130205/34092_1 /TAXON_ID=0 /ORGANISM="Stereomyxa ramosa, Strain Chinc5" /LENGTH=262 /DNA_ID=CAMNT_0015355145 /DNA_START=402 /DNA_END=1190 /DNA_ORIENTATION=+